MRELSTERRNLTRALRKRMTPQEALLWRELRLLKPQGLHFRRQVPLGAYIVDFACTSRLLAVEIDGGQHAEDGHAIRDRERDAWLRSIGFQVLRFWNHDINTELSAAVDHIVLTALTRVPPPHEGVG